LHSFCVSDKGSSPTMLHWLTATVCSQRMLIKASAY